MPLLARSDWCAARKASGAAERMLDDERGIKDLKKDEYCCQAELVAGEPLEKDSLL
jgi:hypothetical protein